MSQSKKSFNACKIEKKEGIEKDDNLGHVNKLRNKRLIKILSIREEGNKLVKCFCCGKPSHDECFYIIDNNTYKNKICTLKKTVKNYVRKKNVENKCNTKVEMNSDVILLDDNIKDHCSVNKTGDEHMNNNEFIDISKDKISEHNILDESFNSGVVCSDKNRKDQVVFIDGDVKK